MEILSEFNNNNMQLNPPITVTNSLGQTVTWNSLNYVTIDNPGANTTCNIQGVIPTLTLWSGDGYLANWQDSDVEAAIVAQVTADPTILGAV